MIHNVVYDATHEKGLEILTPKQILQGLSIALTHLTTCQIKYLKSYILCIEQKKLLK